MSIFILLCALLAALDHHSGAWAARPPTTQQLSLRGVGSGGDGSGDARSSPPLPSPSSSRRPAAPQLAPSSSWPSSWLDKLLRPFGVGGGGVRGDTDAGECELGELRKRMLKPLREMPFVGLFEDLKDMSKFEASGMTHARDHLWIVFDNLHAIGRIEEHFQFRDPENKLLGHVGDDSQFEGLTYDERSGHFYVVEEVVDLGHVMHPYVRQVVMDDRRQTYDLIERCPFHFEIREANKGFEGLHFFYDPKDSKRKLLMGLCEGNYCRGGAKGQMRGNGRLVVAEHRDNSGAGKRGSNGTRGGNDDEEVCGWDVVKVVKIPKSADFMDYSGIATRGNKIAITSQEDSAAWIGEFDWARLEWVNGDGNGQVYHFPRDNHCEMIYCNVEGIDWLDDTRLVIASDKAKSTQPYRCIEHDQSLGIFALP